MQANTADARGLTFECQPGCAGTAASVHTASWVLRTHLGDFGGSRIAPSKVMA